MIPFSRITSILLAPIDHKRFAVCRVMEFLETGDYARLDDVHKLSWKERVITKSQGELQR